MAHVLVVEDDAHIRDLIALHLGLEGLECTLVGDGREALGRLETTRVDLVVLDLMLPGVDGLTVCKAMRRTGANTDTPVLMLTARDGIADKVLGLKTGADDYMTKPFVIDELLARVRANLRRTPPGPDEGRVLTVGDLVVSPLSGEVSIDGRPVHVTRTELRLLAVLAGARGDIVSREQLLMRVWHYDYLGDSRMVDAHVHRLRLKIEQDPAEPQRLLTIRGTGYRLVPYKETSNGE